MDIPKSHASARIVHPYAKLAGLLLTIGEVSGSRLAQAQTQDPAAGRAIFLEAQKAADAEDYDTACAKFVESYKFDPAVGTLLNIANCDTRFGRFASAWAGFQKALDQLPKDDERRGWTSEQVVALQKRLPKLTIRVKLGAPSTTTVERDGVQLGPGSLGVAIPIDPGRHIVFVKAPGRKEQRYVVDISESQLRQLEGEPGPLESAGTPVGDAPAVAPVAHLQPAAKALPLPPALPAPGSVVPGPLRAPAASSVPVRNSMPATAAKPSAGPESGAPLKSPGRVPPPNSTKPLPPTSQDRNRFLVVQPDRPAEQLRQTPTKATPPAVYIFSIIGGAGLIVGVVTRVLAVGKSSIVAQHCDTSKVCDPIGMQAVQDENDLENASTVSLALGVGSLLGVVIYSGYNAAKTRQTKKASVSPRATAHSAALVLEGIF